ncbi:hypothetical protein [Streptomyces sp. NPDC059994]|uniref:hypothetical protein n=1 Tax=Streptomyces sp. NPDC059994 TaxID=3347029 RepID=UPI00369D7361
MSGYTTPYVLLQFPDLGDDVSVLMRNPQLLPPSEITPEDVPVDDKGEPLDSNAAQQAMYKVFARVIVAWKVYDACAQTGPDLGEDADPVALFESLSESQDTQVRLGAITVDNISRMPVRVINKVMETIAQVADPQ